MIIKHTVQTHAGNYNQMRIYKLIKTQTSDVVYIIAKIRCKIVQF